MSQVDPNTPVTYGLLQDVLKDFVKTILDAMDAMARDLRKEDEKTRNELRTEIRHVESKLSDEIEDLKEGFTHVVTKKELHEFSREKSSN